MKYFIYFCFVICVHSFELRDADLTSIQLIVKYGYTPEVHYTITEDGYILELHRIVKSPRTEKKTNRIVFLMHGFPSTSADFVLAGPKNALSYYLADHGYDVWMGNARGNRYSRNHTKIPPENSKFWKFSWHEIGVYDLPASIDYVLSTTKQKTLSYIGFSQGTTTFFVMCSERPEYQKKINFMQALAPVTYLYRMPSRIARMIGLFANRVEVQRLNRQPYEYMPNTLFVRELVGKRLCRSKIKTICSGLLYEAVGSDTEHNDERILPVLLGHFPAGASSWNIAHFGQLMETDRFGRFDYGKTKNLKKYGQVSPPDYNISNIRVPIMIIYSRNDKFSLPEDVFKFRDALPNLVEYYEPDVKEYNHLDYVIAKDVREILYTKMLDTLIKYTRN